MTLYTAVFNTSSNSFLAFRWKDRKLRCFLVQNRKDACKWLYAHSDSKYRRKATGGKRDLLKERKALIAHMDRLEEAIMPANLSVGRLAKASNHRVNQIRLALQNIDEMLQSVEMRGEWFEEERRRVQEKPTIRNVPEKVGLKASTMVAVRTLAKRVGPIGHVASAIALAIEGSSSEYLKGDVDKYLRDHFKSNREAVVALFKIRAALTVDLGRENSRHSTLQKLIPLSHRWTLAGKRNMPFAEWRDLELHCLAQRYGK